MARFADARQAKEFLVSRIVAQAEFEGVSLSEIERKELYFSETGWTLPDMMQINEEFDRTYSQLDYEAKIAPLIRDARKRDSQGSPDVAVSWAEAVEILNREDHYILVMIDEAEAIRPTLSERFASAYEFLRGRLKD